LSKEGNWPIRLGGCQGERPEKEKIQGFYFHARQKVLEKEFSRESHVEWAETGDEGLSKTEPLKKGPPLFQKRKEKSLWGVRLDPELEGRGKYDTRVGKARREMMRVKDPSFSLGNCGERTVKRCGENRGPIRKKKHLGGGQKGPKNVKYLSSRGLAGVWFFPKRKGGRLEEDYAQNKLTRQLESKFKFDNEL